MKQIGKRYIEIFISNEKEYENLRENEFNISKN